jgi:transcriptional regulator with XRE-family HTH domain
MKEKERDTPLHDELRQILKERRFRAGLTQRQLADRLGWDHKVISNLERGS